MVVRPLSEFQPPEKGRIARVGGKGEIRRRLLDMGVVTGAEVEVERVAPLGDPVQIKVKGYDLALRKEEAENIQVELLVSRFSEKSQAVIECINHLIGTLLYWTIAFCCFKGGIMVWKMGAVSDTLSLPLLPFYVIIGIGCLLLGVVLLTDFLKSVREVLNK